MFERIHADKLRKIKLETFNLSPSERREQIRKIIDQLKQDTIPYELIFNVTTLNHLQSLHIPEFIIKGMQINGVYYQPTFYTIQLFYN